MFLQNNQTTSLKIGQKVPIKTSDGYDQSLEGLTNPTTLLTQILQLLSPKQNNSYATFDYEDVALQIKATPHLNFNSYGKPSLNLSYEFINHYPETEKSIHPIIQQVELKTRQKLVMNKPVIAAEWAINKNTKSKRPVLLPFIPFPQKKSHSKRKSIMILTAKPQSQNIEEYLLKENILRDRLESILSSKILTIGEIRQRRVIP